MIALIRPAGRADVPAMSRVLTASIIELCATDHGNDPEALAAWTRNKSEGGVAAMLDNPDFLIFVAELDGAVAAVGAITRDGTVALNYVAPTARFRGLSKAMMARLEAELKALGFTDGRLEATATALKFYQATGWIANGPQASGRKVNGYPMTKALTA